MVDGEFVEEKKITDLRFRGSTNQRKIDVKASLKNNKAVQLKFGDESRYENKERKIVLFEEYVTKDTNKYEEKIPVAAGNVYSINKEENIPNIQINEPEIKIAAQTNKDALNENLD